jgi:hypothetical protein
LDTARHDVASERMPRRPAGLAIRAVCRHLALTLVVVMTVAAPAAAVPEKPGAEDPSAEPAPAPPASKLTVAYYDFSSNKTGLDINLRHAFGSNTGWIGVYHQTDGLDQARAGYEYDYHRHFVTFVPSIQGATHGFVGATVYGEIGSHFYGIAGAGRTDLKPYWNLGFDPNDYVQFGTGYRDDAGNSRSVYAIRDNRLGTGQTNTHFVLRQYLRHDWRLTLDVVNEHGHGDEGLAVSAWAESVDADWRRWFVRLAADPRVNYTADRQFRVAFGTRF